MSIERVAVLGAGTMGAGIAQVCAQVGCDVALYDVADEFVAKGRAGIEKFLSKGVDRRQYQRLTDLQVRPENRYVKTIDEIWKLNQRYDDLHFNKDSGLAPDGSDLE